MLNENQNNQQFNSQIGWILSNDIMPDEEMDRRIKESVLGRYGHDGEIGFIPSNKSIDEEYRAPTIDLIKERKIPLNHDTATALKLSQAEIDEIKAAQESYPYHSQAGFTAEDQKRIDESIIGRHCKSNNLEIPVIFNDGQSVDLQNRKPIIDLLREGAMPLSDEVADAIHLTYQEYNDIIRTKMPICSSQTPPSNITQNPCRDYDYDVLALSEAEKEALIKKHSEELKKNETPFFLARRFLQAVRMVCVDDEIFVYDSKERYYYLHIGKDSLNKLIYSELKAKIEDSGNPSLVNSIEQAVELILGDSHETPEVSNDYLNFQDGILNLQTGLLEPFCPDCFTIYRIEAFFKQGAYTPTPYFNQMLSDLSDGDPTWQQRMKEVIGYLLAPLGERKKLILLQGVTNSGKSTIVNFINSVLSPGSVYVLDIENFAGQFTLANLPFKTLCEIQDMPNKAISAAAASKIKQMTGHDILTTDVKYKSRKQFKNTAKLVFATNHAFFTKDGDAALKDRIAAMPFLISIPRENRIPNLLEKLSNERDGIVYQCLKAYCSLPYSADFTGSGDPKYEVNYAVKLESTNVESAISMFVIEAFTQDPNGSVFLEDAYNLFCNEVVCIPLPSFAGIFRKYVENTFDAKHSRKRKPGQTNPQSCLEGIAFKQ